MPSTQLDSLAFRFVPQDWAAILDELLKGRNDHNFIDILDGGGGDDVVLGMNGSDLLIGGDGRDEISGNDGGNMDFSLGDIVDAREGVDVQQLIAQFLDRVESIGLDLQQIVSGLVDILDNASNLDDVIAGIGEAIGNSPDLQQLVDDVIGAIGKNFTWEQDERSDDFNASPTFEENGVDIIGGYDDDDTDGVVDIIDFSDAISFSGSEAMEEQLDALLSYDPDTGALGEGSDNWFFVFSNVNPLAPNPADTVYVEVDGNEFSWNSTTDSWDMVI